MQIMQIMQVQAPAAPVQAATAVQEANPAFYSDIFYLSCCTNTKLNMDALAKGNWREAVGLDAADDNSSSSTSDDKEELIGLLQVIRANTSQPPHVEHHAVLASSTYQQSLHEVISHPT